AEAFTEEDLGKIEAEMQTIVDADYKFERVEVTREQALEMFTRMGESYKLENIARIPEGAPITIYRSGEFVDLCRGPHVASTGQIKAFKLLSVAGAYWRADERNPMLQRIYCTAFSEKKDLAGRLHKLEEGKRRARRRIGKELDLFSIEETVGGGLVLWHPKGARVRYVAEQFWREEHYANGYELVATPHVARENLW